MHLRKRQTAGGHGERQNGGVGGIDLPINRRRGQIVRQEIARGVNGRLHFLLRDAHGNLQRKLQRDHRRAPGTDRRQLVNPRYLTETALKRCSDCTRRHRRARTRVERKNLDRGKLHLRECCDRQESIGEDTGEQQRHHQEARRHRTEDERARGVHYSFFFFFFAPSPLAAPSPPGE